MAVVLPFRGIRYDLNRAGAIDTLIAPPYDVVTRKERDRLVAQNPCNIFALELPDYNGDKYARAAGLFNAWLKDGVLEKEDASAIYPYEIEFSLRGRTFSRRGMVALIRIEDWESRIIRPHEKTFDRVIEDRYRLLETTKAQFSQIFVIYRHNRKAASSALALGEADSEPLFDVRDQAGNNHRLWRLTGKDAIRDIHDALFDQPLYIADGHHRYTTALKYKRDMDAILGVDPSRPSNYLMAYLVDAEDPGLVVLPTHRIVTLDAEGLGRLNELSSAFEIEKIGNARGLCAGFEAALAKWPDIPGFGVALDNGRRAEIWRLKGGAGSQLPIGRLDAAVLEDIVLKVLPREAIAYSSDGEEAVKGLGQDQALFFLRPTPVNKVLDIADQGFTMPHKSTFFYPKILTGLVLNSVDEVCHIEML